MSFVVRFGIVGIPAARVVGVDHRLHGEIGGVGEAHRAEGEGRAVLAERPAGRDEAVLPAADQLAPARGELEVGAEAAVLHAEVLRPGGGLGGAACGGVVVHVDEDLRRAGGLPVGDHRLEGGARAVLHGAVHLAAVVEGELAEGGELHGERRAVGEVRQVAVERDRVAVEDRVFHFRGLPFVKGLSG